MLWRYWRKPRAKDFPLIMSNTFTKMRNILNTGTLYVRWMDNAVVTMISSRRGSQEVSKVRQFLKQEKMNIFLPQPELITKYNCFIFFYFTEF